MAVGLSSANLANKWLDMLSGTAFTAPAGTFVKLHTNTGDPGAAGAGNVSSVTTRPAVTWAAAAAGSKTANGTLPSWTSWAGTSGEVVGYLSVWDAAAAGNFLFSVQLTAPKTMNTGDTLNLTSLTFSLTPVAA